MARSMHVACVASMLMLVPGQIYEFQQEEAPGPKSLHTLYAFYMYSHIDAPEKSVGQPFIEFQDFSATMTAKATQPGDYESVQVGLLPYKNFWELVDPHKFCSSELEVRNKLAKQKDQLFVNGSGGIRYIHTVPFKGSSLPKDSQARVIETGVYILLLSNCGEMRGITVSGSVIVKNAYGFLPGNEYHKMPFYGWLALGYGLLAFTWMTLSLRWWRELFALHYCIAVVILLGLVETFIWFVFYKDWNDSGLRSKILFILAIMSTVVKSVFSYMLALVASLGWGVTRPYLDRSTILKVQGISILYIILDFVRQTVLSFRHSHTLSLTFVLLCLLPMAIINGAIFYWIFTALANLMETLKERRQIEKLRLFERLWTIIIVALTTASVALVFQIFDLSRSINVKWHYQWFFADGISHAIFFVVLMAMMYLWAPHMHSKRYAYSQTVAQEDGENKDATQPDAIWADEELGEDEEDDSFFSITHAKPTQESKTNTAGPATIGASSTEERTPAALE